MYTAQIPSLDESCNEFVAVLISNIKEGSLELPAQRILPGIWSSSCNELNDATDVDFTIDADECKNGG